MGYRNIDFVVRFIDVVVAGIAKIIARAVGKRKQSQVCLLNTVPYEKE